MYIDLTAAYDHVPRDFVFRVHFMRTGTHHLATTLPKLKAKPQELDHQRTTVKLIEERKISWENHTHEEERKETKKKNSMFARNDYRDHVESVVQQIEKAHAVGRSSETFNLTKQLSGKKSSGNIQPSKDDLGNVITDMV